jgi:FKBP-type peptidyl-prolyl cis-trans isomerase 2
MNPGDFVYIEYIGRIKDSGEIFDLTREDVAKKEGLYNPKFKYNPVPVIVDADFLIPGLNEALKEMKVGEKKTVEIPSSKAFGERQIELIKIIPEAKFKEQGVDVKPGSIVTISRINGRVISVDGGRVKVDFNHPLAGKSLEYELEVKEEIKVAKEKIMAVVCYFTGLEESDVDTSIKEKEAEINIKKKVDVLREVKQTISSTIIKWVKEIEKVKFVEIFEK